MPYRFLPLALALLLQAPAGDDALTDRLRAATRDVQGTVSLYARNLDTGREVAIDADTRVRTASTIKLPILCALESLVAAGTVRWDERFTVRKEATVSGSGVLAELSDGATVSLRDAAVLMIIVSDNTATNLILDRITADAVNDYLDRIGLPLTRSMRKIRGDGTQLKPAEGWSRAGTLPENERYGIGSSTPREMVRLLEMLAQGKIVSPSASKDVLQILERQQYKTGIGRHAGTMKVASKSGSLDALRSDVGIIDTPGGRMAIAITIDGMPVVDYSPDNVGERLIWTMTEILIEGLR